MKKIIFLCTTIILTTLFVSCNGKYPWNNNDKNIENLVISWNNVHNSKELEELSELYDASVKYYGTNKEKEACIENKLSLQKKHPDFYQQIYGDIQIEELNNNRIKCSFIKRVTVDQVTKDYPSYLTFEKTNGEWRIIEEGDFVTDRNLAKKREQMKNTINKQDYRFEPNLSILVGKIKIETYWGPPGFGENPESDSREDSYILTLENSINVLAEPSDEFNTTHYNIHKIQLTASNIQLSDYKNKKVIIRGTFFGASSGHHHTDILLDVKKIESFE